MAARPLQLAVRPHCLTPSFVWLIHPLALCFLAVQLYVISVHYTVPEQLLRAGEAPVIDWTVSHRYSDFEALRAKVSGANQTKRRTKAGTDWK